MTSKSPETFEDTLYGALAAMTLADDTYRRGNMSDKEWSNKQREEWDAILSAHTAALEAAKREAREEVERDYIRLRGET